MRELARFWRQKIGEFARETRYLELFSRKCLSSVPVTFWLLTDEICNFRTLTWCSFQGERDPYFPCISRNHSIFCNGTSLALIPCMRPRENHLSQNETKEGGRYEVRIKNCWHPVWCGSESYYHHHIRFCGLDYYHRVPRGDLERDRRRVAPKLISSSVGKPPTILTTIK